MPKINVLKPFKFTSPAHGQALPKEHHFSKGEHEVSDEVANHPWIARDFADGHIETPQAAAARTTAEAEAADVAHRAAMAAQARAQGAMDRLNLAHVTGDKEKVAGLSSLDTPVNQMKPLAPAPQKTIDVEDPEIKKALNTPVDQLPKIDDVAKPAPDKGPEKVEVKTSAVTLRARGK